MLIVHAIQFSFMSMHKSTWLSLWKEAIAEAREVVENSPLPGKGPGSCVIISSSRTGHASFKLKNQAAELCHNQGRDMLPSNSRNRLLRYVIIKDGACFLQTQGPGCWVMS